MTGGLHEGEVGVVFLEIDVGIDVSRGVVSIEVLLDGVVVAAVKGSEGGLVALLFFPLVGLVDELVKVALFHVVFIEEANVVSFGNEVGSVVISAPLVGSFGSGIDDAPLNEDRMGGGDTELLRELVVDVLNRE